MSSTFHVTYQQKKAAYLTTWLMKNVKSPKVKQEIIETTSIGIYSDPDI